jgi:3-hydroxy-9,10-secoandrosta-1,3,5(10)-triene-9,17-dione monooxygenase reductase component
MMMNVLFDGGEMVGSSGLPTAEAGYDEIPSVQAQAFKAAMCKLASGVSVLTTVDQEGSKIGLTMTAVISVSLDPPLVLACIDNRSRAIPALAARKCFNIHILDEEQEPIALHFAGSAVDKFRDIDHEINEHGCPRVAGSSAILECVADKVFPAGDHTIVIGRVFNTVVDEQTCPLIYHQREFYRL